MQQSQAGPEPGSSTHPDRDARAAAPPPPASQRRRPSFRSSRSSLDDTEESTHAPPSVAASATALTRPSPQQRGSSRGSDMQRSSSPADSAGTIRYTRTGRVSKATKGQRVHQCDECGKTYTRAEHLRRHQQNHKPGAFPCDVAGCDRSFHREDLLTRHKARHNDPLDPPTRRGSVGSLVSAPGAEVAVAGVAPRESSSLQRAAGADRAAEAVENELAQTVPTTTTRQSTSSRGPRKDYIPITELPVGAQSQIPVNAGGAYSTGYSYGTLASTPPYSPPGYSSPSNEHAYTNGLPYYSQPHLARARTGPGADFFGGYGPSHTSRSPASASSSTGYVPQWDPSSQSPALQNFASSSSSDVAFGGGHDMYTNLFYEQPFMPAYLHGSDTITARDRDLMEKDELLMPTTAPASASEDVGLETPFFTNEQRYLDAYWMWIHPLFPVVHKPTFDLATASPLLQAAMLALGAHIHQNRTDMGNARIIHERCLKVLKKRQIQNWHSYRVCDMQAIFLIEVYSIYKSRRPPLQLSRNFEVVYAMLANTREVLAPEIASLIHDSPLATHTTRPGDGLDHFSEPAMGRDISTRKRLLLSCYILDQQHATIFGRPPTNCLTSTLGIHLPWLSSQAQWDAPPEHDADAGYGQQPPEIPRYTEVSEALSRVASMTETSDDPHDAFESQLMMACLIDPGNDCHACGYMAGFEADLSPVLFVVEQSPRMRLAYHTFMLAKNAPIRDLLAVAGESWVMAEKLGSQDDYIAAQIEARHWAKGNFPPSLDYAHQSPAQRVEYAVFHALQILDLHSRHPTTGLLFQEWAIYLAAVVFWARAYVTNSEAQAKPRLSIPTPAEPRLSAQELDQTVTAVIRSGGRMLGLEQAKQVLLWTKAKIEKVDIPHNCGLTNGALDVLGKLSIRGSEDGWFGS